MISKVSTDDFRATEISVEQKQESVNWGWKLPLVKATPCLKQKTETGCIKQFITFHSINLHPLGRKYPEYYKDRPFISYLKLFQITKEEL